jgi:hypothetical protein
MGQTKQQNEMNYDFKIETIKINPQTKWEREEQILTYWTKNGKMSQPIYEETNVEELIKSLSQF